MNKFEKILLRLLILARKKFGYKLPQLNEARPIKTNWWAVYRHHGRLIRLVAMTSDEAAEVDKMQLQLNQDYARQQLAKMDTWISEYASMYQRTPDQTEREKWMLEYELENEKPEYRPCSKCVFSTDTPGCVLPCPYYNVVAGSTRHACCTHKYEIVKDVEKL